MRSVDNNTKKGEKVSDIICTRSRLEYDYYVPCLGILEPVNPRKAIILCPFMKEEFVGYLLFVVLNK